MSRADVDMDEILRVFGKKYWKELKDAICESIPSGVYRDFLVALATKTTQTTTTSVPSDNDFFSSKTLLKKE